jgi:transcriptional regulator NrdR family protein
MRCPHCSEAKTAVVKVVRPLDEGLCEGDIKKRTRKCRGCARNFVTFEIHESEWRQTPKGPPLVRRPLLNEARRSTK